MTSRLSIMRECLTLTGNNLFATSNDGTPEWNVASAAFDAGARWLYDVHDWNFAETITEITAPEDDESPDPNYTDVYMRPADALHVIRLMDTGGTKITDYRIIGNFILVNDDGGILVEHVVEPHPDDWPGLFTKAITHTVMAGCYRGLNKDATAAQKEESVARGMIAEARPRTDLQEPGKARFTSTLATSRTRRRG